MADVTRRELIRRAAATGLGVALVPATGVPDFTPAEAATFGDGRIGARIRAYRKRLGLSQEVLAHRIGKSRRWLQKVEAGELLVEKLHDLLELADVLHAQPSELVDRPVPIAAQGADGGELMAGLRGALLPRPYGRSMGASTEPPQLQLDFELACRLYQGRHYAELARMLPDLVAKGQDWLPRVPDEQLEEATWLLLNVYCMTGALCQRFGDLGLAWVAVTLADQVAGKVGLPLQQAVVARGVVNRLFYEGRHAEAGYVATAAAEQLASTHETPEQLSARGFLVLKGAVSAARLDDAISAWRMHGQAAQIAERLGTADAHHLWTAFGPANVELHGLDLALNLGDPRDAVRRADHLDPRRLAVPERKARYWIDVSRAYMAESRRDDAAAVSALLQAERIDPWEVHHQAIVRATLRVLLHRERRSATPGLRGLAERVGVLAST